MDFIKSGQKKFFDYRILKVSKNILHVCFKVKLAEFRINLDAMYCTNSSKVVEFEKENVEKRMLDHLTYNKITIEDGDYQYSWDDQETERAENGFKSGVNDSGMEVEGEDEAMMMPAGMM